MENIDKNSEKSGFNITKHKAYRTKRKALKKIHSEFGEQYLVIK